LHFAFPSPAIFVAVVDHCLAIDAGIGWRAFMAKGSLAFSKANSANDAAALRSAKASDI
jgi:hypothetical protein